MTNRNSRQRSVSLCLAFAACMSPGMSTGSPGPEHAGQFAFLNEFRPAVATNSVVLFGAHLTDGPQRATVQTRATSRMDDWNRIRYFEPPASASSKDHLIRVFKSLKCYFTAQEVRCSGTDFMFFTLDKGSGMYLIHGYLYKIMAGHPVEVMVLYPQTNTTKMTVVVEGNKLAVKGDISDKRSNIIADYVVSKEG